MDEAAQFSTVFIALWTSHQLGDYWIQTERQAANKGRKDAAGRRAVTEHVATLTATKMALLALAVLALNLQLSPWAVTAGLATDAASHWWADRRFTLESLAAKCGKSGFYRMGSDTAHTNPEVTGRHLGTGAHALDQSFHAFFLFTSALIMVIG